MKVGMIAMLLCGLLSSCASAAAPTEEILLYPATEDWRETVPSLPFTLPIFPDETLHPTLIRNQTNGNISSLLYEGLFVLDESFTAQALLVEEYHMSEDGKVWTFTLKEGISFWDGTELTPSIVLSAWKEAQGEDSRYASRFQKVSKMSVQGESLRVELLEPNAQFPALLDIPISYGGGLVPQGTGPYYYQEHSQVLERNPLWWGEADLPDTIALEEISSTGDLITAFDGGNLSILQGDLVNNLNLGFSGNYQVWEYPSTHLLYLGVDTLQTALNQEFRVNVSQCIHREQVIKEELAGYGTATSYPIHPATEAGQTLEAWSYDPFLAAEQLSQGGSLPSGLRLLVNEENPQKVKIAQSIVEHLQNFSYDIQVEAVPWVEFLQRLEERDFDLYLSEIYLTPDFDISSLFLHQGEYNYGMYGNVIMQGMWEDYRREGDALQFFQYFAQEMPIIPLCFKEGTALSLWGHLNYASPTANHLFYGLEEWDFAQESEPSA